MNANCFHVNKFKCWGHWHVTWTICIKSRAINFPQAATRMTRERFSDQRNCCQWRVTQIAPSIFIKLYSVIISTNAFMQIFSWWKLHHEKSAQNISLNEWIVSWPGKLMLHSPVKSVSVHFSIWNSVLCEYPGHSSSAPFRQFRQKYANEALAASSNSTPLKF